IVISDSSLTSSIRGDKLHIIAEFDKGSAVQFGLSINGYELSYDILKSAFFSAPSNENIYKNLNVLSPYDTFFPINETLKLEVIVDRMGMEVFVNDGDLYFVNQYNSVDTDQKVEVFARGRGAGKLLIKNLEVHELKSIWEKND